jgi:cytochrome b561
MRTAYRALGSLIALAVALQVASIAWAGFTIAGDAEDGVTIGADYSNFAQDYHSMAGTAIGLLALVFLIVSFLTDVPRGRMLAAIVLGLVVVQFLLAVVSFGLPALGVLHGINGLAIAAVAGSAARRASTTTQPATSV